MSHSNPKFSRSKPAIASNVEQKVNITTDEIEHKSPSTQANQMPDIDGNKKEKANNQAIRIAVLGATGGGKSTICNLLCGNSQQFEVNDFGFDSKTQAISSVDFTYTMSNEQVAFEVMDTPGFFDTEHKNVIDKTLHRMKAFANDIHKCRSLTGNGKGIDVFLLVIPMGPLTDVHKNTIEFMRKYFNKKAAKHVILVISKCKGHSVEKILENIKIEQEQNKNASNAMMEYLKTIEHRCIATECEKEEEIKVRCRDNTLNAVRARHLENKMMFYGEMWREFECEYRKLLRKQTVYYKAANLGIVSMVTALSFAIKFRDDTSMYRAKMHKYEAEMHFERAMRYQEEASENNEASEMWEMIVNHPFIASFAFFYSGLKMTFSNSLE